VGAAKRLVGETYAIGFVLHSESVHEERNLCGEVGMGASINRGCRGYCVMGALGGHALRPKGRVQRSVVGSLSPLKIMRPLFLTVHLCLSKMTLHPTSVNTRMPNSDAMDNQV
jgi:hypothetical protein